MVRLVCFLFVAGGYAAQADTDNPSPTNEGLSEIVVTATRREEKLKDVPISVSVLSTDQINDLGLTSSQNVALLTPGLTFSSQVLYGLPYIRGVGSSLTTLGTESSVALYIDGVYQALESSLVQNLDDIERIEVLKGPQGALYGRNATGGAINIVTKAPESGFTGSFEETVGNYNLREEKINVSGGTETLSASFSGFLRKHDGYYTNLLTGDRVENENDYGGLFKVRWRISDTNTLTVAVDSSNTEGDVGAFASQLGTNNVLASSIPGAKYTGAPLETYEGEEARIAGNNWQRTRGGSAVWLSEFQDFDLHVTAGLRGADQASAVDPAASSVPLIFFAIEGPRDNPTPAQTFHMWSVEPLLTSKGNDAISWLAGGLFYRDGGHLYVTIDVPTQYAQETNDNAETEAYAGYAQGTYHFGNDNRWSAVAGLRYSDEKKTIYSATQFLYLGGYEAGTATPATAFPNQDKSWDDVTGSASLSYDFGSTNVYGRWAQGFKSGAYNLNDPSQGPVNPEKINSFELGVKSTLDDGHLELAAAVFYYDYKNLQLAVIDSATGGAFEENAANARIKGAEFNARALPISNLQVQFGLSLLQAKYTNFPNASVSAPCADYGLAIPENCTPGTAPVADVPAPNLSGKEMVDAPKVSGDVAVVYTIPVSFGKFDISALANYSGLYYFDAANRLTQNSYTVANGSVTYHPQSDRWFGRIWANNFTNSHYLSYDSSTAFGDFGHWADPRTFGVTLGVAFH
jgi:iron complex outermembrane receptor protein